MYVYMCVNVCVRMCVHSVQLCCDTTGPPPKNLSAQHTPSMTGAPPTAGPSSLCPAAMLKGVPVFHMMFALNGVRVNSPAASHQHGAHPRSPPFAFTCAHQAQHTSGAAHSQYNNAVLTTLVAVCGCNRARAGVQL